MDFVDTHESREMIAERNRRVARIFSFFFVRSSQISFKNRNKNGHSSKKSIYVHIKLHTAHNYVF